jgi:hypothetical protein
LPRHQVGRCRNELLATVVLIWPGFGVTWFGAGGDPNANLDALGFSHQRAQYELSQLVPLAVIIVIGIVFYLLGSKTRQQVAPEPVSPDYAQAAEAGPAA